MVKYPQIRGESHVHASNLSSHLHIRPPWCFRNKAQRGIDEHLHCARSRTLITPCHKTGYKKRSDPENLSRCSRILEHLLKISNPENSSPTPKNAILLLLPTGGNAPRELNEFTNLREPSCKS